MGKGAAAVKAPGASWCLEYAQPSPKHLVDTQQICTLLGISPLTRFEYPA